MSVAAVLKHCQHPMCWGLEAPYAAQLQCHMKTHAGPCRQHFGPDPVKTWKLAQSLCMQPVLDVGKCPLSQQDDLISTIL